MAIRAAERRRRCMTVPCLGANFSPSLRHVTLGSNTTRELLQSPLRTWSTKARNHGNVALRIHGAGAVITAVGRNDSQHQWIGPPGVLARRRARPRPTL